MSEKILILKNCDILLMIIIIAKIVIKIDIINE